jgi:hypothetical protein
MVTVVYTGRPTAAADDAPPPGSAREAVSEARAALQTLRELERLDRQRQREELWTNHAFQIIQETR